MINYMLKTALPLNQLESVVKNGLLCPRLFGVFTYQPSRVVGTLKRGVLEIEVGTNLFLIRTPFNLVRVYGVIQPSEENKSNIILCLYPHFSVIIMYVFTLTSAIYFFLLSNDVFRLIVFTVSFSAIFVCLMHILYITMAKHVYSKVLSLFLDLFEYDLYKYRIKHNVLLLFAVSLGLTSRSSWVWHGKCQRAIKTSQ